MITKITRRQLRQLIIETMITPSNLLQRILKDPQIDTRIKSQIEIALSDNDQESINQLLQYVAALNPEYTQEIDTTQTSMMMPDYRKDFNAADRLGRTSSTEGVYRLIENLLKPFLGQLPDLELYTSTRAGDEIVNLAIQITTKNLNILQQIETTLQTKGIETAPIESFESGRDFSRRLRGFPRVNTYSLSIIFDDHLYGLTDLNPLNTQLRNLEMSFRKKQI